MPPSPDTTHQQVRTAVSDGLVHGGSLAGSIVSGTLLGYFADQWLGTDPWLVITGILLGSYSGFLHMWNLSKKMVDGR